MFVCLLLFVFCLSFLCGYVWARMFKYDFVSMIQYTYMHACMQGRQAGTQVGVDGQMDGRMKERTQKGLFRGCMRATYIHT